MSVMSLGRIVSRLAAQDPDAVAVHDGSGALTRGELDSSSNRLARVLLDLGVAVDDVITVGLPSDARLVQVCAAIWKAGAVPQPLDPSSDIDELRAIVELAQTRLVIGFDGVPLPAPARLSAAEIDDVLSAAGGDGPVPDVHASSWKAPVSGGSTGRPKIIFSGTPATMDPDRPTAAYIPAAAVQLVTAPLHHSAPFLFAMRGLFLGHTLVLLPRFDAEAALAAIERHRVTWALLVPTTMRRIRQLDDRVRESYDVSSLQSVLHLGASCPQWLKREWIAWLGPERVDEIYAGTESTGVTYISGAEWLEHPGSVGRAAPGFTFRVLDEQGSDVAPGTVGEVFMQPRGGPGSTYRYAGADSRRVEGFESLGDLGWMDVDGYVYLADRAADVVVTSAGRVFPAQVEAVLDAHPAVRSSAVFGLPDGEAEYVHAVAETDGSAVVGTELVQWCADRLPAALVPRTVETVTQRLRDDAGKVRRSGLRRERLRD